MKRVLILLAVATITAESVGCCCPGVGSCCPCRRLFYQGDYCGSPCCPTPVAAAPCCPAPVAAAPCCPAPMAAAAPCCPAPQYQYAAPQVAPMMAYPANVAPNYGMTYAMEPSCASPKIIYDAGWMMDEPGCGCPGMGSGDGILLQSPDEMVYPGPAE